MLALTEFQVIEEPMGLDFLSVSLDIVILSDSDVVVDTIRVQIFEPVTTGYGYETAYKVNSFPGI